MTRVIIGRIAGMTHVIFEVGRLDMARGRAIRRWGIGAVLVAAAAAAPLVAAAGPSATGYVATRNCQEHQAFLQGDAPAVAARLPRRYKALVDPGTGSPVLFVRALRCR